MSNYPDAEDVFTPVTGSDEMSEHAERHTAEEEAIVAIQKTLGTNPDGTNTTVVERLDAFDAHTHDDLAAGDHTHDSDDTKLDKGTTSYADAQEIQDAIEAIVVPDVSDFVTGDDLTTALSGKADDPHTHDEYLTDLTHDHDGTYQPVGDYATKTELSDGLAGKSDDGHTHDTTHDHEEYFLSGATVDEFGQPIPLPYANAKLLGDEVDEKADKDHTHEGFAADDHTHDAPEINTSQVTLAADSVAGFHELEDGTEILTQADVNIYLSENAVFKGTTWGDLAGRS